MVIHLIPVSEEFIEYAKNNPLTEDELKEMEKEIAKLQDLYKKPQENNEVPHDL